MRASTTPVCYNSSLTMGRSMCSFLTLTTWVPQPTSVSFVSIANITLNKYMTSRHNSTHKTNLMAIEHLITGNKSLITQTLNLYTPVQDKPDSPDTYTSTHQYKTNLIAQTLTSLHTSTRQA